MRALVVAALAAVVAAGTMPMASGPAAAEQTRTFRLATATTGGTFYPVGVALATLVKIKLHNTAKIDLEAITSTGSLENIELLREKRADFAIVHGLVARSAADGAGPFKSAGPQKSMRGVMPLWFNYGQFVVAKSFAQTGRIGDLTKLYEKKYSLGARSSSLEALHLWLFANLGIDHTKFDLAHLGYGASSAGLVDGSIAGTSFEGGLPTAAVHHALSQAGDSLAILEFTEEDLAKANGQTSLLSLGTIPADTYPNQPKALKTVAVPNFLVVDADVPEDVVYAITKAIFENLPFLHPIHDATKEIELARGPKGHPFALHPGAAKYYTEKDVR
jgi:TRAP transporter TAXI family solute receptor